MVWTYGRDGQYFSYFYDGLDRLTWVATPGAQADVTFGYDLLGRQLWSQTSGTGGFSLQYAYDALSRPQWELGPLGFVSWSWDAASRNTRITWPDGFYAAYDYDLTGAMTAVREDGATSGNGVLATYGYDPLGRRISAVRGNGVATAYGWDGRAGWSAWR